MTKLLLKNFFLKKRRAKSDQQGKTTLQKNGVKNTLQKNGVKICVKNVSKKY